jgi:hypothetical protein
MTRFLLSMTMLAVMSLACAVPVGAPPTPSPLPATATRRAVPSATAEAEVQTIAVVRQPVVQVHDGPSNESTVSDWVEAGQEVVILKIDGDWVQIAEPPGWVYVGCLEGLSEKGCVADE